MLKNILNLNGAQQLSKKEQLTVNGGRRCGSDGSPCAWHNGSYKGTCYHGGCYVNE